MFGWPQHKVFFLLEKRKPESLKNLTSLNIGLSLKIGRMCRGSDEFWSGLPKNLTSFRMLNVLMISFCWDCEKNANLFIHSWLFINSSPFLGGTVFYFHSFIFHIRKTSFVRSYNEFIFNQGQSCFLMSRSRNSFTNSRFFFCEILFMILFLY